jgi:hypothetical protein
VSREPTKLPRIAESLQIRSRAVKRASLFRLPGERAGFSEIGGVGQTGFFGYILDRPPACSFPRATRGRAAGHPWSRPCSHGFCDKRPRVAPGFLGFSIVVGTIVIIAPVPVAVLPSSPLWTGSGALSRRARPTRQPCEIYEGAAGRDPSVVQSRLNVPSNGEDRASRARPAAVSGGLRMASYAPRLHSIICAAPRGRGAKRKLRLYPVSVRIQSWSLTDSDS